MRSLKELHEETARRADTAGLKLSAADVSRVIATMFRVLAEQGCATVHELVAKGLAKASQATRAK